MKKIFTLLMLSAVAFSTTSCDETNNQFDGPEENETPGTEEEVTPATPINYTDSEGKEIVLGSFTNFQKITTENVYIDTKTSYNNEVIAFYTNELEVGYTCGHDAFYSSWDGFAVSTNMATDVDVVDTYAGDADYNYEFSAYADEDVDGDDAFVLCYCSSWSYPQAAIKFEEPKDLSTIAMAPAAILASYNKKAEVTIYDEYYNVIDVRPITDYTYTVTIIGYDADGAVVATTETNLADKSFNIISGWRTLPLYQFKGVSSLGFTVTCQDDTAPTYFCLDALKFK